VNTSASAYDSRTREGIYGINEFAYATVGIEREGFRTNFDLAVMVLIEEVSVSMEKNTWFGFVISSFASFTQRLRACVRNQNTQRQRRRTY
jgi:hypothetical protein